MSASRRRFRLRDDRGRRLARDIPSLVLPGNGRWDPGRHPRLHPGDAQHVGVTPAGSAGRQPDREGREPQRFGSGEPRPTRHIVEGPMILPLVLVTLDGANPDIERDLDVANTVWGGECE